MKQKRRTFNHKTLNIQLIRMSEIKSDKKKDMNVNIGGVKKNEK